MRAWAMCMLLLISNYLVAQKRNEFSQPLRKLASVRQVHTTTITPRDTVRMLAIMVEFKKDAFEQTTGDGTFQTSGSSKQIDPPPHDSLYFQNKIQFVRNYFKRVSNGKLTLIGNVYGQNRRITLSKPMKFYSPPTFTNDNKELADLAQESWQIADSLYPEINFSQYNIFVIFHAGVGRDIELVPNYTPFDIPSLYLDSTAFAAALRQSSFQGFVHGVIKNTIILPETESRDVLTGFGTTLLQLSINGLFAASVGSYLGLPDLFNTKTGSSGIGQFGLMDGAAIFAYSGLFPPEPSAWEKMFLGWVTPIIIGNSTTLSVPAVGLKYPMQQDTVYKIPITSSEYFIVENRNRNPKGTGVDVKIADANGDTLWRHFDQDTPGFNTYTDSLISGSIVDVSNFDWALVGYTDTTHENDGGGILIWHIDESVIQAGLSTNSVNTNPNHRGVDLEEADGAKDIGLSEPGSGPENGSPLDCWFAENNATPYKNIFDQKSFPNSNSFSAAASVVTLKNFSVRSPRMTLTVEFGNLVFQRDSLMRRAFKNTVVTSFPTSTKNHLYLPTSNGIYALQNNGQSLLGDPTGILVPSETANGIAVYQQTDSEIAACVQDSTINIFHLTSLNNQGVYDSVQRFAHTINQRFTTSPCFAARNIYISILVGTYSGKVFEFNVNGDLISQRSVANAPISSLALLPTPSLSKPEEYFCTSGNKIYSEHDSIALPASQDGWMLAAAVSRKGNYLISAEKNGNRIISFDQSLSLKNYEISIPGSGIQELAIADIDGDGEKDAIIQSVNSLSVINRIGSMLDGFPIQARNGLEFTGTPLVVDFNGDAKQEVILLTNDGEMWVYDRNGKLLSGFPVEVTSPGKAFPMAYTSPSNKLGIAILSENGSFDAYLTSSSATSASLTWWQHLGDERHSNAEVSVSPFISASIEFFPKSRVYNWPNPVYGQSTQIRYFTAEDANVTITILDLSGVKITELTGQGTAGMDNEVTWNVSNIQSGVYLARVDARGVTKSEVVFIKIAVVK
ncbi:MAG: T9SS type A sorting domain-containing protein [Ignavibacteriales bacterium]|nr:T9SS type A sorting domain-containing protein [Ignavibacteriales bacterium]